MKQSDIYRHENAVVPDNNAGETSYTGNDRRERLAGIRQRAILNQFIRDLGFDADGLQAIHETLNVATNKKFAGKFLTSPVENIYKDHDIQLPRDEVQEALNGIGTDMVSSDFFSTTSKKRFSKMMANAAETLLKAHAFPAKNESTNVVFMTKMASEACFRLDWSKVPKGEFWQCVRSSVKGHPRGRQSLEEAFQHMASYEKDLDKAVRKAPNDHAERLMQRFTAENVSRSFGSQDIGENGTDDSATDRFTAKNIGRNDKHKPSDYGI